MMQKSEHSEANSPLTAPKAQSPATRQAAREQAEAAALAELQIEVDARRTRSAKLRKLRLQQSVKK